MLLAKIAPRCMGHAPKREPLIGIYIYLTGSERWLVILATCFRGRRVDYHLGQTFVSVGT